MNYRLLTLAEVELALAPYGCEFLVCDHTGFETWVTGWGYTFTLSREPDRVHYDEWTIQQVIVMTIAPTLPAEWAA